MHPLGPLGVEPPVRLLVLGLEHADRLALHVTHEVRARGPLGVGQFLFLVFKIKSGEFVH